MFVLLEFIPAWAGGPPGNRAGRTLLVLLFSHDGPSTTVSHLTQVSISPKMDKLDRYCDDSVCDISGPAEDISYCPLIPLSVAEGDALDVFELPDVSSNIDCPLAPDRPSRMGIWPTPRWPTVLSRIARKLCCLCVLRPVFSPRNLADESVLPVRQDLCNMFTHGDFILAPTYQTYLDTMRFVEHSGVKNRKERDHALRRPLTAVSYRIQVLLSSDSHALL